MRPVSQWRAAADLPGSQQDARVAAVLLGDIGSQHPRRQGWLVCADHRPVQCSQGAELRLPRAIPDLAWSAGYLVEGDLISGLQVLTAWPAAHGAECCHNDMLRSSPISLSYVILV